jgi:hypothetical protein
MVFTHKLELAWTGSVSMGVFQMLLAGKMSQPPSAGTDGLLEGARGNSAACETGAGAWDGTANKSNIDRMKDSRKLWVGISI